MPKRDRAERDKETKTNSQVSDQEPDTKIAKIDENGVDHFTSLIPELAHIILDYLLLSYDVKTRGDNFYFPFIPKPAKENINNVSKTCKKLSSFVGGFLTHISRVNPPLNPLFLPDKGRKALEKAKLLRDEICAAGKTKDKQTEFFSPILKRLILNSKENCLKTYYEDVTKQLTSDDVSVQVLAEALIYLVQNYKKGRPYRYIGAFGQDFLHYFAHCNLRPDLIEQLLQCGSYIDKTDDQRYTPLCIMLTMEHIPHDLLAYLSRHFHRLIRFDTDRPQFNISDLEDVLMHYLDLFKKSENMSCLYVFECILTKTPMALALLGDRDITDLDIALEVSQLKIINHPERAPDLEEFKSHFVQVINEANASDDSEEESDDAEMEQEKSEEEEKARDHLNPRPF